jgi:DNA-binding IclR family transcriptional regulator
VLFQILEYGIGIWNMTLTDAHPSRNIGVLDRTMAILDAVEFGARSFTQIAEATGFTRPTTHRLIKAMEDHGLLTTVGGRGYRLGPRLLALAATAMRDLPLRDLARPALERLCAVTGESAQLYIRDGDRRVCIDAVESPSELRTIVAVGASLPLTKGSAGKVFLAWGEDPRGLAAVRLRGWAESVGERAPGVASVSAPVFDPGGGLAAAVSVSGPADRLGAGGARYGPAVAAAAREIQAELGASAR